MKRLAAIFAVVAISGCAALPQSEPPHYDHSQQAMIAPGYPVERVPMPAGFEFADIYQDKSTQGYDAPDDTGSATVSEIGVSWVNPISNDAVATVLHQGSDPGSYWKPWLGADGYEFVGDRRVQYLMQTGRFNDVSGDPASTPRSASECAVNAVMITYSRDRKRRTLFTYTEGRECSQLATLSRQDAEALRQRAYQVFRLR